MTGKPDFLCTYSMVCARRGFCSCISFIIAVLLGFSFGTDFSSLFASGRAVRLLPNSRYSSAPATGNDRMTSSHSVLYAVSTRWIIMYSTSRIDSMERMRFITAAYGDSHFIRASSTSTCIATAGSTDIILRSVLPISSSLCSKLVM